MTRALKFRAWDPDGKRMLYIGEFRMFNDESNGVHSGSENDETGWTEYALEQFTGLEDRNGSEIYEGDIVRLDWIASTYKGAIEFRNGAFAIIGADGKPSCSNVGALIHDQPQFISVIGNIHGSA